MSLGSRVFLLATSLFLAAAFVRLGFWQLDRLQARRIENRLAGAARALPEIELVTGGNGTRINRLAVARGEYLPADELILRGYVHRELPGVQVVTPLRLAGSDSVVLVNRGFVPAPDAITADTDSLVEPGPVIVRGVALALPLSADSGGPRLNNGRETWRRLDLDELRRRLPYPLLDVYLLQSPDTALPRLPLRLEPPPLDDGPHLSYAIQWFAFATIAVAGGTIFLLKKAR